MTRAVEPGRGVDAEARADLGRDEPPVETLAERRRQPVQLLEGAELQSVDARVPQPAVLSPLGADGDGPRGSGRSPVPEGAGAREILRGVQVHERDVRIDEPLDGLRRNADDRTSSKRPTTLSWPARRRRSIAGRHALP